MSRGLIKLNCDRFDEKSRDRVEDLVAPEVEVGVHWPGRPGLKLYAFPEDLDDLAFGHALLECCPQGVVPSLERQSGRDFYFTPEKANGRALKNPANVRITAQTIVNGMDEFMSVRGRWEQTGCFHRMALMDLASGELLKRVEDIGRHNCVDRLAAWVLKQGLDPREMFLLATARATASLARKILRAGFSAVVSRSAVSLGGVELAAEKGMTLVGFARNGRFTVYTDARNMIVL